MRLRENIVDDFFFFFFANMLMLSLSPHHFFLLISRFTFSELDHVWEVKPLLDGKAIMDVLQLKTGGPMVKEWVL